MATQLATPGVFFSTPEILIATSSDRGSEAPGGRRESRMTYPWSSTGRNPVGRRANPHTVTPMTTTKTRNIHAGRRTIHTTIAM